MGAAFSGVNLTGAPGTEPAPVFLMNVFFSRAARLGLLVLGLFALSPSARAAGPQPITVKELSLMLRGGYTSDDVLHETAGRPLLEPLDEAAEKTLVQAGADARLINALKTSRPTLSDADAAAARQRQADLDHRKLTSWEDNQARLTEAHKQASDNVQAERKQEVLGKLAEKLRGQLVTLKDTGLQPFPDSTLDGKKLFAFYFASLVNPQCTKFTPQLLKFYQDFAPKHPAFEVVFVSLDRSPFNMENNMRQNAMPWPALGFDHLATQPGLANLGKQVIPRLTLLDGAGRVVADSVVDGKYVGPQHVLDELERLAAPGAAGPDTAANVVPAAQ